MNNNSRPSLNPLLSLSDKDLKHLLELALSRGGDFAEIYLEYLKTTKILLDEDKLKALSYGIVQGAGIRVNSGEKTGYAYSDDFEMFNLKRVAEAASFIAQSDKPIKPFNIRSRQIKPHLKLKTPAPLMGDEKKIDILRKANQAARDFDPRIQQVKVEYYDEGKRIMIVNSEGLKISDVQYIVRLSVYPLAIEGRKRFDGYATSGGRVDADHFAENPPESTAKEGARQAIVMLNAGETPAGLNPVVVGPGWGGVLVHEAFGHSLEGDGIRKKTSLMSDKLGKKVASDVVRMVDDATIPCGRGSFNIDDEGTSGQRKVLVNKGMLQGFLYDKLNAKLMETQSTGSGRRESYRCYPIPRMSNTFIDKGEADPDDIIKSVRKGIFAKKLGGGSVDTSTGNFNFLVREAYLIEEGKVKRPVKGAVLIGNGPEAMKKIELVGNDLLVDSTTGTCGKDNQSIYVGVGQPTVKFKEITVGGTKV
jgi:TldD protein